MKFGLNDWVQITPTPDTKWHVWYNEREIYDNFCGKIGQIININDNDPSNILYDVMVHFPKGYGNQPKGNYFQMFKSDHLIKSSAYDAKLQYNLEKVCDELQDWERAVRIKRDEIFKHIYNPKRDEDPIETKSNNIDEFIGDLWDRPCELPDDPDANPDQWDVKTVPNMTNPITNNSTAGQSSNTTSSNTSTAGNTSQSTTSTYTDPYDISFYDTTD